MISAIAIYGWGLAAVAFGIWRFQRARGPNEKLFAGFLVVVYGGMMLAGLIIKLAGGP